MSRYIFSDLAAGNITASTTASGYPVTNLSNYNPKDVWKATAATATLTVTTSGIGLENFAIFNANDNGTITYILYNGGSPADSGSMTSDGRGNHWLDPLEIAGTHIVFSIATGTADPVSVGILRMGGGLGGITTDDPTEYDYAYEDFSLVNLTRNQAINIRQKERIWIMSGTLDALVLYASGIPSFLFAVKENSPYPIACKMLEKNFTHFVFGQLNARTSGSVFWEGTAKYMKCTFELREVL